jgi:hypothetical protein
MLHESRFNGLKRTTHRVNSSDQRFSLPFDVQSQGFDGVGPGQRVDCFGDPGLVSKNLLGSEGDRRRGFGGKRKRFVA